MNPKEKISISVLVILHLVGVVVLHFDLIENFIYLTPFNLLASLGFILWNHPTWNKAFYLFLVLCFSIGLGIEIIGIQTGAIFGNYQYGGVLGPKVLDTSLMIGVNWIIVSYCAGVCTNYLISKSHWAIKAILGATLMVGLDFFIEPVAIKYGMWTWELSHVPLQNYIGWFIISWFILALFFNFTKTIKNKVAVILFILQLLFFLILGL